MDENPTTPETPTGLPEEQVVFAADDELCVVARYPYQMQKCQAALVEWAKGKVASEQAAVDDLNANLDIAVENRWATGALDRAAAAAVKRVEFYTKIKLALEAGYCIVPNFPVDMFAVRTKRKNVDPKESGRWTDTHAQEAQALPAGAGEYRNPEPVVHQIHEKGTDLKRYFAADWRDLEFPFATAKPAILAATQRAMADKFFDEIGVLPGKAKKQDPIVVGRVIDPRGTKHSPRVVTFLVAWWLDTRVL